MEIFITILEKTTVFVECAIVLTFFLSAYFTVKYMLCVEKWEDFCYLKVLHLIGSIIWVAIYSNALIQIARGKPIDVNLYGMVIVRPAILFTGITMMLSARNRYFSLLLKGDRKCRKPQKN